MQPDPSPRQPPSSPPSGGSAQSGLDAAVLAQAKLRVKLGFPVWALMLACIAIWGPASRAIAPGWIAGVFLANMLYNLTLLLLAREPRRVPARAIVPVTAVLDPLMLSAGLALTGEPGQAFIGFYLFTMLGFGFRIGPEAMRLCQLAAIAGFGTVALTSPSWRAHPVTTLAVLILLTVVPLYARILIGKLRDAQALAESESRAKSQLLANVSHELRTPLTGIISSAQLLREAHAAPEVLRRCDAIVALSRDLMLQINDLLDSARHEAGALQLEPAPFAMRELAEQLRSTLAPTALTKGIALQIEVDQRIPPRLCGDAHYLKRVLLNIAGNAVKFTEHGEVALRIALLDADSAGCLLHFGCRDTGIGIAPELQQRIFEPFFQASSGITRRYGGTGLGMSIAREIVALMGGALRVTSEPGSGSLFEFTLRLPHSRDAAAAAPKQRKRILIADDNATNLLLLQETLERDGHQVLAVCGGTEAIAALSEADFDLVILDFNMADIDGATVLKLYRFGRIDPAPAYILTADMTAAPCLADSGAAGILHKPLSVDALRQAVAAAPVPAAALRAPAEGKEAYLDAAVVQHIREISDDPAFMEQVLLTAAADIERLSGPLLQAIESADLAAVQNGAHALRGVCASVGAARLGSVAARLMHIALEDLRRDAGKLRTETAELARRSLDALRRIVSSSAL